MKELIRNILREDINISKIKKYIINTFERQVKNGKIPSIPFKDLERKKIYDIITPKIVSDWYIEFVGGKEQAFEYFKQSINYVVLTEKDLSGILNQSITDTFTFKIYGVTSVNYKDGKVNEIEFIFDVLDGNFETDGGVFLTWSELMPEDMDDLYHDVSDWVRGIIEDYVDVMGENYGFNFTSFGGWT